MVLKLVLSTLAFMTLAVPLSTAPPDRPQSETLSPDVFASVSGERSRVAMHIDPGIAPGSVRVLTGHDVQEFDSSGKRIRTSNFPNELWRPRVARLSPGGPQRIIGVKSGFFRSWIDVLDESATRLAKLNGWQYGMLDVADVVGDAAKEILVRYPGGVAVLQETGRRVGFIRSPRYLYHFGAIEIPDSRKRAVAMWMWIDARRGVDISVFRGDGSTVAAWHEDQSERFNVFSLGGPEGEGLWSAPPGRFVERTVTGAVRRSYNVPDMMRFRYMHGGALADGRKVLVGSMGTVASLVCVFDAAGTLIGRSTLPLPSLAFYVPDPNGTVFFVGNGENVLRYDAASLAAAGASAP